MASHHDPQGKQPLDGRCVGVRNLRSQFHYRPETLWLLPESGNQGNETGRKKYGRRADIRISNDGGYPPAANRTCSTSSPAAESCCGRRRPSSSAGEERVTSHGQPITRYVVDHAVS